MGSKGYALGGDARGSAPCSFFLIALLLLPALGACGKKGPPAPPGPADQIIYPKVYPTR